MIDPDNVPYIKAKYFRPGRIRPVELIVIHSMESAEGPRTARNTAHYFQNPPAPASAHYCIDATEVIQCVYDSNTAFHCKNANANGIGLEHAGYARQTREEWLDEYGQKMLDLSAQVAAYLCLKFNIPVQPARFNQNGVVTGRGFTGHADVPNHGAHWDPGQGFPWNWYFARVAHWLERHGDKE